RLHDFEVARAGATPEDADESLGPGRFGMAEETGRLLNRAIKAAADAGQGLGRGVAAFLSALNPPHAAASIAVAAHALSIPLTVHVAIGTDIIHMHPDPSGAALA